jgi:hypothetical protein
MAKAAAKSWRVLRTVELGGSAQEVWNVVGGFFTIHLWHPDITMSEILPDQARTGAIRRLLTFPGQPKTTEELVLMDNPEFHYRYKWHSGDWGERVKDYVADLRVFDVRLGETSIVQWSSTFTYTEDALTEFYENGFRALRKRFPLPAKARTPKAK